MNAFTEQALLSAITILAILIVPPILIIFTPLGKFVKRRREVISKRIEQFKRKAPQPIHLPVYPIPLLGFGQLILALSFMIGLPLFTGWVKGDALPQLFHLSALAVFPLEGEVIFMAVLFVLLAVVAMMVGSGFIFISPRLGTFLAANRVLGQFQYLGVGYVTKERQERQQQVEQIAAEYDLRAWSTSNLKRQIKAFVVVVVLSIPVCVLLGRTGVWVDQNTITVNPLAAGPRTYAWDQVTGIEISVEDVGKRQTRYTPSYKLYFSDQTSVDVWASTLTNLTEELRTTCEVASQHDISIYISPLAEGRLSEFNQNAQKEVLSVINSPSCRSQAYTFGF